MAKNEYQEYQTDSLSPVEKAYLENNKDVEMIAKKVGK